MSYGNIVRKLCLWNGPLECSSKVHTWIWWWERKATVLLYVYPIFLGW